ncbi:MAG: sulfotransferase family 2 domain-containing protein [Verrucomicrobia bacterium]|nr:sulfotransferase family 2 domain-containing protein [Verrucomicrobiota bacterium]
MGSLAHGNDPVGHDETLIFLHIPKTAGSTIAGVVRANVPVDQIFEVESPLLASFDRFNKLAPAQKRALRVVMGHGVYGLHEQLEQPCRYMTMLRDPVDRVVSNYYFILASPNHRLHADVAGRNLSLRDYVESGVNVQIDNGQVRALSGMGVGLGDPIAYGACTESLLARAMATVDRDMAFVGLTEKFDESLLLMGRQLGWQKLTYARRKVTRDRPSVRDIPADVRQVIEARTALDQKLYEHVQEKLMSQLRAQSLGFRWQLRRLQQRNQRLTHA